MQSSVRVLALTIALLVLPFTTWPGYAQEPADRPTAEDVAEAEGADFELEDQEVEFEDEDDEAWEGIEEITVTANKREQALQDVPISMSALQGDFIEESGITEFGQIQQFVPNLKINPTTDTRSTVIRIRGIGSVGSNAGIDPSVGVFIDGVYQGRAGMSVGDLLDIDRVEVLRGPQGTLYGKNTAAGTINIHTKKPIFSFESTAEVVVGNYNDRQIRGSLNVPLWGDRIATRISAYRVLRDGFDINRVDGHDVNDADKWGTRGRFLFDVTPNLEILISGDYSYEDTECCVPDIITFTGDSPLKSRVIVSPLLGVPSNFCEMYYRTSDPPQWVPGYGLAMPPQRVANRTRFERECKEGGDDWGPIDELLDADPEDRVVAANEDLYNKVGVGGTSLAAELALGDFTLSSLSAYRHYGSNSQWDGDFSRYDAVSTFTEVDLDQFSQEFHVISPSAETLEYQGGLYFYFQNMDTLSRLKLEEGYQFMPGEYNDDTNQHRTYSAAVYGQGNYNLGDQWSFTGGLRLSWERKTRVGSQIATNKIIDVPPIAGPDQFNNNQKDWFNVSGVAKIRYFPVERVMIYGSYSRGFKSGGFNQLRTLEATREEFNNTEFDPEYSTNLEAGAKTTWFDRRLTLNGTVFYTWYSDFQAQVFNGSEIAVVNAGSLRSYGVEADLILVPLPDLVIGSSLGFNVAEYKFFPNADNSMVNMSEQSIDDTGLGWPGTCATNPIPCNTQDLAGKTLDNAPRWTVKSYAQYEVPIPIPGFPVMWKAQAEYAYTSSMFLASDLDPNLKQDPTHLLNLRTGFRAEDSLWDVSFWVTNVTDEQWKVVGFDVPIVGGYTTLLAPPRQYGATFRLKF